MLPDQTERHARALGSYDVRPAVAEDAAGIAAVQVAAILGPAADVYGGSVAASWAHGVDAPLIAARLAGGAVTDVVIDRGTGRIVAFCGRQDRHVAALFVAPGHGRRGLARALIARTIAAVETPTARGVVTVLASRLSRPVFTRAGWRDVGARLYQTRGGADLEVFDMERPVISAATLSVTDETPDQPAVRAFFTASEAYMGALYPAESNHFADPALLAPPRAIFLVARLNGQPVGCGAVVKAGDGSGEIKRMWVAPQARGLNLGVRLLAALEAKAVQANISVLRLETGIHQPEAIGLYRRAGFFDIGPFADYQPDPLSLFMEKQLLDGPARITPARA